MLDDTTRERIQNDIGGDDVVLFMKGTPFSRNVDFPPPLSAC